MLETISKRRSIRKYTDQHVSKSIIEEIIKAGMLAPSSKNRQPWHFTVVADDAKIEMINVMKRGIEREKERPLIPESAQHIGGAEHTLNIMEEAPVVIFITNTLGIEITETGKLTTDERVGEICNAQSIGAAIENMCLAATELGLGSLWICDTFFAQAELREWLAIDGELYAALAIGYANESPTARPRKDINDIVEWRGYENN